MPITRQGNSVSTFNENLSREIPEPHVIFDQQHVF